MYVTVTWTLQSDNQSNQTQQTTKKSLENTKYFVKGVAQSNLNIMHCLWIQNCEHNISECILYCIPEISHTVSVHLKKMQVASLDPLQN